MSQYLKDPISINTSIYEIYSNLKQKKNIKIDKLYSFMYYRNYFINELKCTFMKQDALLYIYKSKRNNKRRKFN